jgi:hypothetical protein
MVFSNSEVSCSVLCVPFLLCICVLILPCSFFVPVCWFSFFIRSVFLVVFLGIIDRHVPLTVIFKDPSTRRIVTPKWTNHKVENYGETTFLETQGVWKRDMCNFWEFDEKFEQWYPKFQFLLMTRFVYGMWISTYSLGWKRRGNFQNKTRCPLHQFVIYCRKHCRKTMNTVAFTWPT